MRAYWFFFNHFQFYTFRQNVCHWKYKKCNQVGLNGPNILMLCYLALSTCWKVGRMVLLLRILLTNVYVCVLNMLHARFKVNLHSAGPWTQGTSCSKQSWYLNWLQQNSDTQLLGSRTIHPSTILSPDNCPLKIVPQTIPTKGNYHADNCPPDNPYLGQLPFRQFQLGKLSQDNCPLDNSSGQFPPRTIGLPLDNYAPTITA